ncbi:MAG: phosphopantothenoylcysteine decarboxylase [Planctomycetota bacterium]
MRFLITAGPTREMIDAVRYLSNLSSGRTGIDVAAAARDAGHTVALVLGPTPLSPPDGIDVLRVVSARDMRDAVMAELEAADVLIMSAAVADYRPQSVHPGKLKKGEGNLTLELVRNPDILLEAGDRKGDRIHLGFALEVQDAELHARRKLERKRLDALVLNGPENLAADRSAFRILTPEGLGPPEEMPKAELGRRLVALAEELAANRGTRS